MTVLGDGPFFDVPMWAADGNINWDSSVHNQDPAFGGLPGSYAYAAFSTSVIGAAAQYSARWWWRDFGSGGLWDIKMIHVSGFDVGIYSIRIDDREVARLDGYSLADVNNIETIVTRQVEIGPGRHKITIQIRDHNPACTGTPWYPAVQGLLFRRVGALPKVATMGMPRGKVAGLGGQVINVFPLFATGNTDWDTLLIENQMVNGYELYSNGAQNAARWWDLDLAAGTWAMDLGYSTGANRGMIGVQIDGVTLATVDTYSASTVLGVRSSVRFSVPSSGPHRLTLIMATKNGSSSGYVGDVSAMQLRQVPGAKAISMPQRIIPFTTFWSSGHTNWDTLYATAGDFSFVLGGDMESGGAQNDARWWDLDLAAGTWALDMLHAKAVNRGIYSIRIDGIEAATIDGYAGDPGAKNVRSTVTGIKVPSSGVHRLALVMATKHASSSSYYGTVTALQLRRTA